MTGLSCGVPRVFHAGFTRRVLMMNLLVWCTSSVPRAFNLMSEHDKSACNKGDALQIIDFYTREMCRHMHVPARMCQV